MLPNDKLRLLLDRRIWGEARNITLKLAPCEKYSANPLLLDGGTYWCHDNLAGLIRHFPEEGLFKGRVRGRHGIYSEDGLDWRTGEFWLGADEIVNDPDPDPSRRYKTVFHTEVPQGKSICTGLWAYPAQTLQPEYFGLSENAVYGIGVAWSENGHNWNVRHPILEETSHFHHYMSGDWGGGDGYNHAIWCPELRQYVCFVRTNLDRAAFGGRKERAVGRMVSDDFEHWSPHEICFRPWTDWHYAMGEAKADYYHLPVFRYGGVYLSFMSVFYWETDTVHIQLAWSPDTLHWEHLCRGEDLIPHGEGRELESGCNFAMQEPILLGDEMRVYYGASAGRHNAELERTSSLCLATFKRDRFAGVQPEDSAQPAILVTKPLQVEGDELWLNADVAQGNVRVQIRDNHGNPLANLPESQVIASQDSVRIPVHWKDTDLKNLYGRDVRLVFHLNKARLYAFGWC